MKLLDRISKEKYWDYFILGARFLIGWTFLRYGFAKLTDGQFGISETELGTPLKDLSLFRVSWYLFDHQPFKAFIGVAEVICGSLLIINRTAIIGAFMFLPIITTVLLIDITFMPSDMANAFAWRFSFYILLDLLILWYYKSKMAVIWNEVWQNVNTRFRFPIWAYLLLPPVAIAIEVGGILFRGVLRGILNVILYPITYFNRLQELIINIIS